jgi:hypothetical protein
LLRNIKMVGQFTLPIYLRFAGRQIYPIVSRIFFAR